METLSTSAACLSSGFSAQDFARDERQLIVHKDDCSQPEKLAHFTEQRTLVSEHNHESLAGLGRYGVRELPPRR